MKDILTIKDLHVEVGGNKVLKGVDLEVRSGEVHLLLGPNGSGKTSLMKTIMGYPQYKVTQGKVFFKGTDITNLGLDERAKLGIRLSEQSPPVIAGVSFQSIMNVIREQSKVSEERHQDLFKQAGAGNFKERSLNDGLSGGETKRSELLLLLAANPALAMMDEPDSGIDVESLNVIGSIIKEIFAEKDVAGLITTHSDSMLRYIKPDWASIMFEGSIICTHKPEVVLETIMSKGFKACADCKSKKSKES